MGGGVGIAADEGDARQGEAELGADDVDDALIAVAQAEQLDAVLTAVVCQGFHLVAGQWILNAVRQPGRRHVVIGRGQNRIAPPQVAPARRKPSKA